MVFLIPCDLQVGMLEPGVCFSPFPSIEGAITCGSHELSGIDLPLVPTGAGTWQCLRSLLRMMGWGVLLEDEEQPHIRRHNLILLTGCRHRQKD